MLTLISQPLSLITYTPGKQLPVDMLRGVKTHRLYLRLQGTIVVASGGAGNVQPEPYANLISEVRILEGGIPRVDMPGTILQYLTARNQRQFIAGSGLPSVGSALAAGTYTVSADFAIDFANVWAAGDPSETAWIDVIANTRTQLEITWPTTGALIGTANPGNVDFSGLSIQAVQFYDTAAGQAPYFAPRLYRGTSGTIAGAVSKFPTFVFPQGSNRVAGIIFHPVTAEFTDPTVITSGSPGLLTLQGDRTQYKQQVQYQHVLNELARFFNEPVPSAGYLEFYLRQYGKLSEMYVGGQDQNLRLLADVDSGSTSVIEWYTLENEIVDGVTAPIPAGRA